MGMYKKYKTDKSAEENGREVDFGDDLIISVRAMHSSKVRAMNAMIAKRNASYFRNGGSVPTEVQDSDDVDRAVAIVAGWRGPGATDEAGNLLDFTEANVRQVMTDLWELRDRVIAVAVTADTFRAEAVKADAGNLKLASGTPSNTPTLEA